jgi:branched-chain amino acid transport system substrate-binding protein
MIAPIKTSLATVVTLLAMGTAQADINVGVSLSLTGPGSGLGIPMSNQFKLFPNSIAGEKINFIVLDDGTDPTKGMSIARRFVTEEKVDLIDGSPISNVAAAISEVANQSSAVQVSGSPVVVAPGRDKWLFRMPQSNAVMGHAIVEHMKKTGIKSVGFFGYNNDYGDSWLKEMTPLLEKAGIKLVDVERFARTDTGVIPRAVKLKVANPDAVLVVAAGSVAAMPVPALADRGYSGKVYQPHAVASQDLMRVGGKAMEGAFVVSGPAVVADQLPHSNSSKKLALEYAAKYEKVFGQNTRNQLSGHAFDFWIAMERAVPMALKKA